MESGTGKGGDTGSALSALGAPLWLHLHSGAAEEDGGTFWWMKAFPECCAVPGAALWLRSGAAGTAFAVLCNEIIQAFGVRAARGSVPCCSPNQR